MAALLPADPDAWHALDAPFTAWDHWQPVPGSCSRCGRPAEHGRTRWWHLGPACRARRTDHPTRPLPAEFIPAALQGSSNGERPHAV